LPFLDEICRKFVAPLLCCLYKDRSGFQASLIKRMVFLDLLLALSFRIFMVIC